MTAPFTSDKFFVDRLKIVDFGNRQDLQNAGGSLFVNTNVKNVEVPAERFSLEQGAYEASNVDIMQRDGAHDHRLEGI